MDRTALPALATYDRTIGASVERIWENVLDWEHLPWLHRSSFAGVRRIDESKVGWRAWVCPRWSPEESLVEVAVDRPALRYVTRTIEGPGAGSEIWTALDPRNDCETRISVEFRLPVSGIGDASAARIGRAYVALYEQLWGEDETMMIRRQTVLDDDRGRLPRVNDGGITPLGSLDEIRGRLPLAVRADGIDLRVVEHDGQLCAYPSVCPHLGGPLEISTDGAVECPWHGYRYDLRDGRCLTDPSLQLRPLPHVRVDPASGEASLHW